MKEELARDKVPFWFGVTNPNWISIKVLYFFLTAGLSSSLAFLMPFFKSLGLTTNQIGVIEFLNILIGIVSGPIIGTIADKTGRHNLVVAIGTICYLIPMTCFAFFSPPTEEKHAATLHFNKIIGVELEICNFQLLSNMSSIFVGLQTNRTMASLVCQDLMVANASAIFDLQPQISANNCSLFKLGTCEELALYFCNETEYASCNIEYVTEALDNSMTFFWICFLRSLSAITLGPTIILVDSITYDMLGKEHRALWGQQRMFASMGWGFAGGIMGVVLNYFHDYRICFISFGFFSLVSFFIALLWLPKRLNRTESDNKKEEKVPFFTSVRSVIASPIFLITCAIATASGMLLSIFQVIWPQHIHELQAPKIFFGMVAVVVCTLNIPSFFFVGIVVNKIGVPVCFLITFFTYILRIGANIFLTPETVWVALPVEILHILNFALFLAAVTCTAAAIAPPGTSSTVQSLLAGCYFGIGSGSGVLLTSFVYHTFGRYYAFVIYTAFAVFCFLVLCIVYVTYLRKAMAQVVKSPPTSPQTEKPPLKNDEEPLPNNPLMADEEL